MPPPSRKCPTGQTLSVAALATGYFFTVNGLTLTVPQRMMLGMVVARDLSDAERQVWDAFATGKLVDFGTVNAEDNDPARGESWGLDRQVHAEVLAKLLCGAVDVQAGPTGGIYLNRARVIGELRLPDATLKHRLRLSDCYLADGIDLSETTTRTLDLRGCRIGAIRLYNAKINGAFNLRGAHLDGKDGPALIAEELTVTADMFCVADRRAHLAATPRRPLAELEELGLVPRVPARVLPAVAVMISVAGRRAVTPHQPRPPRDGDEAVMPARVEPAFARHGTLQAVLALLLAGRQAGRVVDLPVRRGSGHHDPHVDAHDA